MLSHKLRILIAAAMVTAVGFPPVSVVHADTPATSPRLQEIERELDEIAGESQSLGGNTNPADSLRNVEQRIWMHDRNIERLEEIAKEFGESAQFLDDLAKQAGEESIITAGDVAQEGAEQAATHGLKRICSKAAGKAVGWVGLIGDIVEYGGKFIIREVNESDIREMLRAERIRLNEVRELLYALYEEKKADYEAKKRLEDLGKRARNLRAERVRERQRIEINSGRATRHARTNRVTDSEGDAKLAEEEKQRKLREGIRPSDPNSAPPRRRGVWRSESTQGAMNLSPFAKDVLVAHNNEREKFGAPPLQWSPILATGAQQYATELAQTGRRVHSTREGRGAVRENLSQGRSGWDTDQMMASWWAERENFTPGRFPNVCNGDWSKCGHYTQAIWPTTTEIGCGMARGSGHNWLVCRYSPGGNKDNHEVGIRPTFSLTDVCTAQEAKLDIDLKIARTLLKSR